MPDLTDFPWLIALVLALALYVQTITGFAFSLLFLGFTGLLGLLPIPVAANAATLISLIQTFFHFRHERPVEEWKLIRPAVVAAAPGVVLGAALLQWLGDGQRFTLQILLGVVIVAAAFLLLLEIRQRTTLSGRGAYRIAGLLSGAMGGLLATPGPPIVYLLYREPLPIPTIRHALFLMFGMLQAIRLGYVLITGQLEMPSVACAALSIPLAYLVTRAARRYPVPLGPAAIKRLAAALLIATGAGLVISALR